jgi:hypothetical protein
MRDGERFHIDDAAARIGCTRNTASCGFRLTGRRPLVLRPASCRALASRDRRKLDEPGGFRIPTTPAAPENVVRNHPARRLLPARR